jgi:hypothetical protein
VGLVSTRGDAVGTDERKPNENTEAEERDELDDLDVPAQKAEDVRGGKRASPFSDA